MRARRTLLLGIIFLLGGGLFPLLTPAAQADEPRSSNDTAVTLAPNRYRFGVVEAYDSTGLAVKMGAAWERINFWWNLARPNSPRDWNEFQVSIDQIDRELQAGLQIVGVLGNPPAWATRNGSVPANLDLCVECPSNYWAQFVYSVVEQYRGRINHWIVWNEPDIDIGKPGNTWAGTTGEYYQLLKTAYRAAKAANPDAKVLFAGTTYWADAQRGQPLFLERVLREAQKDPTAQLNGYYFDIVPIHIYSDVSQLYKIPLVYRETLRRYGLNKPLWIAEANVVPWNDPVALLPPGGYRATLDEQANFVIQGFALALAAGVDRIALYKMRDSVKFNNNEPYGLVRENFTTRPAYDAYRLAANYLSIPGVANYKRVGHTDMVTLQNGKRKVTVFWNWSPTPDTARIRAAGTSAKLVDKRGAERPLTVPTTVEGAYAFPIPPATANVPDIAPNQYLIGGDPYILVEDGVGDPIQLSENVLYFPVTGHNIAFGFLDFFRKHGGVEVFGYPRSEEVQDQGVLVQYFQRARLEYHPELAAKGQEPIQLTLLNDGANAGKVYPKSEPVISPGVLYFPETGHSVREQFLEFFKSRGGLDIFGYPVSEEIVQPDGKVVQHFQRMRLEYDPTRPADSRFQLGLVGEEYMVKRGMLTLD